MDKAWNGKEKRKDKEKIQRSPRTRLRVLGRFAPKGVLHNRLNGTREHSTPYNKYYTIKF